MEMRAQLQQKEHCENHDQAVLVVTVECLTVEARVLFVVGNLQVMC